MEKEIYNNMDFLIKELHKEWERTGATKAYVLISVKEAPKVNKQIAAYIAAMQGEMDTADMTFSKSIQKSKECFIMLRMARKIKKLEDNADKKGTDMEFTVSLDREELRLFKDIFREA